MATMNSHLLHARLGPALLVLACLLLFPGPTPGTQARTGVDDMISTDNRTVLITGANRGLGLEFARQYAKAGWTVIGTARNPDTAAELNQLAAKVMQLDVTDPASVDRLAQELSGTAIDLLINNAGIQPLMWTLAELDFDAYEQALAVNTMGPVRVTHALLPQLRSGKLRRIVNITTNLSSIADNKDGGFYGYRESKTALNMFTRSLAAELGPEGFICIVLHPGWVQTDLGGPQAPLQVDESVRGMRDVIDRLAPADNGTFRTYSGEQMAW
jgi:NAD(P)-dependent dehydrogenase (short-subunit alcohol dehydrogenase family)